jgi:hypothetical protein
MTDGSPEQRQLHVEQQWLPPVSGSLFMPLRLQILPTSGQVAQRLDPEACFTPQFNELRGLSGGHPTVGDGGACVLPVPL